MRSDILEEMAAKAAQRGGKPLTREEFRKSITHIIRVARNRGIGHDHVVQWVNRNADKDVKTLADILTVRIFGEETDPKDTVVGS